MKRATILDEDGGVFILEYENTIGSKNAMRLEAATYDGAVREAKAFLGISEDDRDEVGDLWVVE